jgi:amino acid transporter
MIEFIPLLFACASGFIVLACNGLYDGASWFKPVHEGDESTVDSFAHMSLVCGVLNSIPAVFFSFDGFYSAAGLQTEMHAPRKMPKALTIGVSIVALFEIFVSTSLLIGSKDGSLFGLNPDVSPFPTILIQVMMVCVFTGMLSVITGSAVYAPRFYESLIKHDEISLGKPFKHRLNTDKPFVGSVYATILFMIVFLITFGVGPWFWDIGNYASMVSISGVPIYDGIHQSTNDMANVLSFVDTYANWNALFAFVCVTFAIFGALRNRWTNKVKVKKSKIFLPSAIVAILIVGVGIVFVFINSFADFGISLNSYIQNDSNDSYNLIGSSISLVMLFTFIGVSMLPALVKNKQPLYRPTNTIH